MKAFPFAAEIVTPLGDRDDADSREGWRKMADASSDRFGDWYHALGALTAVVKLFADGVLTIPADRVLLDRLEQAARDARPAPPIRKYMGSSLPAPANPIATAMGTGALVPPGAAELAAMGSEIARVAATLSPPQRTSLTRRYEHATGAVLMERHGASTALKGFRGWVAQALAGAAGEEIIKQLDHVTAIVQARGR